MKQQDMYEKLPISKIFIAALTLPKKYFKELLRFGLPMIVLVATAIIYSWTVNYYTREILAFLNLILMFVTVNAIVSCHRIFLLKQQEVRATSVIRFRLREIMYIGRWVGIGIIAGITTIPWSLTLLSVIDNQLLNSSLLRFIYSGLISIPGYYLIARLSLALPATAIDERETLLSFSWDLSKGNGWRLTVLFGTIPFLTQLLFIILPSYESMFYSLLVFAAWLIVGVVEIGLLSLSYNYLYNAKITNE